MITKEQATEALNKTRNPTLPVAYGTLRQYIEETAEALRALAEERDDLRRQVESYRFALAETEALEMQHGAVIARLQTTIRNLEARDIHSCGPDCQRSGCVNRRLREQLAAAQAVIAKLREALDGMKPLAEYGRVGTRDVDQAEFQRKLEVLSTPSDDTALREMLAEQWDKAAAEQREAAAKVVDRFISGDGELNEVWIHDITEAIRAMPLVIDK